MIPEEEKEVLRNELLPPSSTGLDVLYTRETMRLYVLQHAADNLRTPLGMALLGVLAGTTASVWSLWV